MATRQHPARAGVEGKGMYASPVDYSLTGRPMLTADLALGISMGVCAWTSTWTQTWARTWARTSAWTWTWA
eukprot:9933774-Alexandrium_andersonii.AAC.1